MTKEVIYVGDPMCSWCWGFSPVKAAIGELCAGRAHMSLVVGGLHAGTTEPQDDQRKKFLREHWRDVNARSGQPFIFDILERDDFVYDTEPPCRAAVSARHLAGDARALEYFSDLQYAFYAENADITEASVLTDLAAKAGFKRDLFTATLESDEMREATAKDFQLAGRLGVTGFPTVVVNGPEGYAYLTVGYQPYEQLQGALDGWLGA